jgi:hypothetical protein
MTDNEKQKYDVDSSFLSFHESDSKAKIEECKKILEKPSERKEVIEEKDKQYKFLVLMGLIRDKIKEKIKNDIMPIIVYDALQNSISHYFEIKFIEEMMKILEKN